MWLCRDGGDRICDERRAGRRAEGAAKKLIPKYSYMTGQACTDCGAVFNIRLNEPEKFKSFVDYAAQVRGGGN